MRPVRASLCPAFNGTIRSLCNDESKLLPIQYGTRGGSLGRGAGKGKESVQAMSSIYSDIILDYYRYPRKKGQITGPRIKAKDSNPLCGDVGEMQMQVDGDNRVTEIKFDANGCAISQASAIL